MYKQIISFGLAMGVAAAALPLSAIAQDANHGHSDSQATITDANRTCIQNAITKRDKAVVDAVTGYSGAWIIAINARTDALKAAWALQDKKARRKAIDAAWKAYRTRMANIRKDFDANRKQAWKQFSIDAKACGLAAKEDNANENSDK